MDGYWDAMDEDIVYLDPIDLACVLCKIEVELVSHLFSACTCISYMLDPSPFQFSKNWMDYSHGRVTLNGASSWKSQLYS